MRASRMADDRGMDFVLDPPRGIGPLVLGMSRLEANAALETLRDPGHRSTSDAAGRHIFRPDGLMVSIECRIDRLIAVELSRPHSPGDRVVFRGIDLFGLPAREVIQRLGEATDVEPHEDEPASILAPDLLLSLWRPFQTDDQPDEPQGYFFSTVLLARPGYYDTPTQAAARAAQENQ